jgi:signal transduction histidine kinase
MTASLPDQPMERFAGMLAHELRNPLASAATNLAVASDLMEESDPRKPFLARAEEEMERLRVLLRSCLELARTGQVCRRHIHLGDMLALVLERAREQGPAISYEMEIERACAHDFDPDLMVRAVENLLENAARAMQGKTGRVTVRARHEGQDLVLEVEDEGPGLAIELAGRAFEPFVTGQKSSGLGLAFVRQVAEAHGGSATAENLPGSGARFTLRMPPGGEEIPVWLASSS